MFQSTLIHLVAVYWLIQYANPATVTPRQNQQGISLCETSYRALEGNTLQCSLTKGQYLDYKEVRMLTEKEPSNMTVKVTCTGGGTVHLPWPFVAKNVVALEVHGCALDGFLSEMMVKPVHPHELKTLIISSVSIDLPIQSIMTLQNSADHVPIQTDCGPTTLETLVLRDIHYDLKITPEDRSNINKLRLGRNGDTKHVVTNRCVYPHLKYIDESGSRKHGNYHLKLVPEYSEFPVLEVYNMSSNNMNHVPEGFQRLHSKKFPALKHVDFSNNAFTRFEFEFPKDLVSCNLRMLDLRRNQISSIPGNAVEQLQRLKTILIDLRLNPLRCDCSNMQLRQLLEQQFQNSTDLRQKKLLSDVTCSRRDSGTGHANDVNLLNFTFAKTCVT